MSTVGLIHRVWHTVQREPFENKGFPPKVNQNPPRWADFPNLKGWHEVWDVPLPTKHTVAICTVQTAEKEHCGKHKLQLLNCWANSYTLCELSDRCMILRRCWEPPIKNTKFKPVGWVDPLRSFGHCYLFSETELVGVWVCRPKYLKIRTIRAVLGARRVDKQKKVFKIV